MNILFVVAGCAAIFIVAYLTYGKFLAKKGLWARRCAQDTRSRDERRLDYVPAKKNMLLGQHFSAIAAAGPINGPIIAGTMFGWVPALIWIILGSIFVGGVHDMAPSSLPCATRRARSPT